MKSVNSSLNRSSGSLDHPRSLETSISATVPGMKSCTCIPTHEFDLISQHAMDTGIPLRYRDSVSYSIDPLLVFTLYNVRDVIIT